MKKGLLSILLFIAYCLTLIKVMVFKDVPLIRVWWLMLNFGGTTDWTDPANFIPFKTIVPYLFGHNGWLIAGINLIGNIALLVPLGFLLPLIYKYMTWKKSIIIGVISGLIIEIMQVILHVGIFDIDDVILNALGVILGYGIFVILAKWIRERKYIHILISVIISIAAIAGAIYAILPHGETVINPGVTSGYNQSNTIGNPEAQHSENSDLCGTTNGIWEIMSIGTNSFTIKLKSGASQLINLTDEATIKTPAGSGSITVLEMGDRVTLVGDWNADGSFTAYLVLVCGI